jgi:hypothetical protein
MRDIDEWSSILSKIFQREVLLVREYETKNKCIGELYKKCKESYQLPYSYFLELSESPQMNYYYQEQERNEYLNAWSKKMTHQIVQPYSKDQYDFYLKMSAENRFYNNWIQTTHYMDNGCLCKFCSLQRKKIVEKVKRGQDITNEKISHDINSIQKHIDSRVKEIQKTRKLVATKNNKRNINDVKIKNTLNTVVFNTKSK